MGTSYSVRREVPRARGGIGRGLAVALVVLLLSLVGLDFVLRFWAERWLADRVEASLQTSAEVDVGGFPFMLHVVRGSFSSVDVELEDVPSGELRLDRVTLHLEDVAFSRSALLTGGDAEVRVRDGTGTAEVDEASLNEFLRGQGVAVSVELRGPGIRASASIAVGDEETTATAVGRLELREGSIVFEPKRVRVDGSFGVPTESLAFRIDLPPPFAGVRYRSARVQPGVLVLDAVLDEASIPIG